MVRANAFLNERDYVIPADVEDVFYDVTKHRIVLNTKARVTGVSGEAVLEKIMEDTTKPTSFKGKEEPMATGLILVLIVGALGYLGIIYTSPALILLAICCGVMLFLGYGYIL